MVKLEINKEKEFNDDIFRTTSGFYATTSIEDDPDYHKPDVKVWAFHNMDDVDVWYKIHGIPMLIGKKNNLTYYANGRVGVFIIFTHTFKPQHLNKIHDFFQYLKDDININLEIKNEIINTLEDKITNFGTGYFEFKIRYIKFINEFDLRKYKTIISDDMIITLDYKHSLNYIKTIDGYKKIESNETNRIILDIKLMGGSDEEIIFDILGTRLKVRNDMVNNNTEPMISCNAIVNGNSINTALVHKDEFIENGFLPNEFIDLINNGKEAIDELYKEELTRKTKQLQDWKKHISEQKVSLHKMYSYLSKLATQEANVSKEELNTIKETMKFLKDMMV